MALTSDSLRNLSDRALKTTEVFLEKPMSVFGNSFLKNLVLVLLILYAPAAAPMLSQGVVHLLGNYAVKLVYIFVLAYLLSGSIRVGVVTSVVIVLGIFLLKKFRHESLENVKLDVSVKEMPTEPVVDRLQLTKSECGVAGNVEANPLDNITQYNAMASHEDSLKPQLLEDMEPVTKATLEDYVGYDESEGTQSNF
jgi:hypothetical protein